MSTPIHVLHTQDWPNFQLLLVQYRLFVVPRVTVLRDVYVKFTYTHVHSYVFTQ